MKLTAVEIADKLKVPRSVAVRYLAVNVSPAGIRFSGNKRPWLYDKKAVEMLAEWYKSKYLYGGEN